MIRFRQANQFNIMLQLKMETGFELLSVNFLRIKGNDFESAKKMGLHDIVSCAIVFGIVLLHERKANWRWL